MPHFQESSTLPAPLDAPGAHASRADAASAGAPPLSIALRSLALLLVGGAVVLAALVGFGLALWWKPAAPWAVSLAAAAGAMFMALPLGAAMVGLARRAESQAASAEALMPPAAAARASTLPVAASNLPGSAEAAGLPGRVLGREPFMDLVAREWARARRYGTGAALLLVEIDRYARLTDALGDAAGEKVLGDLLAATAPTLRGADALARWEAGRLSVFLAHADATGALDVAERIRERAEQIEATVPPRRVRFTVSVGVAHLRPAHLYLQAFVDDVVDALDAARTAGGNCVRAAPVDASQRPAPPGGAARDGHRAGKK
jgi:diguanylate cyclase (GGDEF)-like protein